MSTYRENLWWKGRLKVCVHTLLPPPFVDEHNNDKVLVNFFLWALSPRFVSKISNWYWFSICVIQKASFSSILNWSCNNVTLTGFSCSLNIEAFVSSNCMDKEANLNAIFFWFFTTVTRCSIIAAWLAITVCISSDLYIWIVSCCWPQLTGTIYHKIVAVRPGFTRGTYLAHSKQG